jgi:hypothetical protein
LEELLDITELLLESTEELDEDFALLDVMPDGACPELDERVPASPFLLLLDFAFELLDLESLDCFASLAMTLEELLLDFMEMLDCAPGTESGVTDEEDSSSILLDGSSLRGAKLLSSPQATKTAATKPIVKIFFKNIKITPAKCDKYTQIKLFGPLFCHFEPQISTFP